MSSVQQSLLESFMFLIEVDLRISDTSVMRGVSLSRL